MVEYVLISYKLWD